MSNEKTVLIEFSKEELTHLINDTIAHIWKIKEKVFGDEWTFSTDINEVVVLTKEQIDKLSLYGYYSRKLLLDKLQEVRNKEFPELTCCG